MVAGLAAAAGLVAMAPAAVAAQLSSTVDAGALRVRYPGTEPATVVSLTPAVTYEHARGVIMGAASLSRFDGGGDAIQAVLAASLFAQSWNRLHLSVGAGAEGARYGAGVHTGRLLGEGRLHWLGNGRGAWIGGSGGAANDAVATRTVARGEVGAWLQRRALTVSVWGAPAQVEGGIRYVDAEGALRWSYDAFEFGASAGTRSPLEGGARSWAAASATYWVTPHVALVLAGGGYPGDPSQALPYSDYLALSARLATRATVRRTEPLRPPPVSPPVIAPAVAGAFEIGRARDGQRTIVLTARGARTVELMGDFTEWRVVRLQPAGADRWRITLPVAGGTYRFNVRVDGGVWGAPEGVTTLRDEFSGVVAVLHLP